MKTKRNAPTVRNSEIACHRLLVVFLSAALAAAVAWPGRLPAARAADAPAGDAAAGLTEDDLVELLEGLTPEQLDMLIDTAMTARLQVERQQVLAELREGVLYDPDDVDAAAKILFAAPADTQQDNIDRICRAFAKVDLRFAEPYRLLGEKKYAAAAAAAAKILDIHEATYLSAAKLYIYAEALVHAGRREDGVEAYRDILANMPERISFAASAALRAAEAYEKIKRRYYAMEMYAYCLKNYGLTLSKEQFDRIYEKVQKYAETYKDPLGSVAKMMGDVRGRLALADSGKQTRDRQEEIVALLEDLIKTAEEQQSSQSPQQQPASQQNKGSKPGEQAGQGQAKVAGRPSTPKQPTSPMQRSMLVPGAVKRPSKLSQVHQGSESGDWAHLPPRDREKIRQIMRKQMSERYRQIIRDYLSRLAEEKAP